MPSKPQNRTNRSSYLEPANGQSKSPSVTQELVREIADRVFMMLLHDLKIERERGRFLSRSHRRQGEW